MENISDKIKGFNQIMESFLVQSSPIVGTSYHFFFLKITKVNATLPITNASKYLIKHRDQIFRKDESYFSCETNLVNDLCDANDKSIDESLKQITMFKEIYFKLDESSRENLWSILQALVQLTIEYCDLKKIKY
jgi:hypothetical protein